MMITDPGQYLSESWQIVRPISQKNKLRFGKLSPSRSQDVEMMETTWTYRDYSSPFCSTMLSQQHSVTVL